MNPLVRDIRDWCRGRSALVRLPLWLYLLDAGWHQWGDPFSGTLFSAIDLGIHEGGHLLLRPLGNDVLHAAGGTLAQLGAPVVAMIVLWRQRDYFGVAFGAGWLSTNLVEVGIYMADARAQELPLVTAEGGGEGVTQHDWNFLFGHFGLLSEDTAIGAATRGAGAVVMMAALLFGAWLMIEMARLRRESR